MVFEKIAIVRKLDDTNSVDKVVKAINDYGKTNDIHVYEIDDLPKNTGEVLFVALGGDGTMIHAARESLQFPNSSVVGFNFGQLGFLVDDVDQSTLFHFFRSIQSSNVIADERMALEVQVHDKIVYAINEVVLSTDNLGPPFRYNVYINKNHIGEQHGSGVMVSTSTGSTAMALSAGGAIVSPSTNIMQIVPIIPHSLSARPIITSGRDEISLEAEINTRTPSFTVTVDGQVVDHYPTVQVRRHRKPVKIWRAANWNFFDILSRKLGW